MHPLLGVVIAYLAGSIPSAHIAGRLRGLDLRKEGSGNLGATNVARVLGWKTGVVVMLADMLKGVLPVALLPDVTATQRPDLCAIAFGVAAILGHVRPVFLMGKGGGKGVATAAGVFLALAWLPFIATQIVFFAVAFSTRYVSLASLSAAVMLPIAILLWTGTAASPVFLASIPIVLFVFWTHRQNIGRLRRGEEPKFSFKKKTA
ncbi:MAG: glycerol-3-phosphate 1-O-acyltransferase PlsY [Gemmatimonadaceae bacterium]|nr:glycerol-3-phosphate 1-O-acyltransferase PlsY [Gemmatimonadaceae bacterium]